METQEQQTIVTPKKNKKLLVIGSASGIIVILLIGVYFIFFMGNSSTPSMKFIPYKSGDKWGYIDKEGKILINPQFNYANAFISGLALVKSSDDKYGYIGEDGKYKINATYKDATCFSEGLACVVPENGKPTFIDEKGNVKFTVSTGEICGVFSEGLAAVKVGDKWGYLDKAGNIKINAQFSEAFSFNEGLAPVSYTNKDKNETLWGFINNKGDRIINYQFKAVGRFNEGLAIVYDGKKYGFIDKTGKYVINPQFDLAGEFNNGLAIIKQGSMYGYCDKDGKIIINPQFNSASRFSNDGIASVSSSDGKYGYIDKDGKYTINPQFDRSSDFIGGIAFVRSADKYGIIDKKGKYLVNPQFDNVNVEIENYRYQTVQSDYFDISGLVEKFLEGTDQKNFKKLSGTTTLSELKVSFPNLSIQEGSYSASVQEKIILNEFSSFNISFNFSENPVLEQKAIYRTVEKQNYFKGKYKAQEIDHYESIPNDKATLGFISINLSLSDYKAVNKSEQIFKGILDALVSKASVASSGSVNVYENNYMSIVIGGNGLSRGNYALYQVTFKKNP